MQLHAVRPRQPVNNVATVQNVQTAGCVKVNGNCVIKQDMGTGSWLNTAGWNREGLMRGDRFIIYSCELNNIWTIVL